MVTPTGLKDGIASYSRAMLEALGQRNDVDARVVELPKSSNPFRFLNAGLRSGRGAEVIHVQYQQGCFGMLLDVRFLRSVNYFPLFFIPLMAYRILGRKIVYTVHELNTRNPLQRVMLLLMRLSGHAFIAHSGEVAGILASSGVRKDRITELPFPVSEKQPPERAGCKRALGLDPGKPLVLLFGFIHSNKGFDLAIPAARKLKGSAQFLIAGSPRTREHEAYHEDLKKRASGSGIIFHGFVPDERVPEYMGAADVALVPYRWIQNSLVINDFLCYRIPVLASDLPYFTELKERFGCIETFKSGDADDLGRKLSRLLSEPGARRSLSERAGAFLAASDVSRTAAKTADLYRRPAGKAF